MSSQQVTILERERPGYVEIVTEKASQVLAAIPEAQVVGASERGPLIQMPYTQAYAEILADMRAPHAPPMVTEYGFKASFDPFPHQYRMAGMMSTHKRFFCLADPGCVDGSTEYLSRTGWKRIDQYTDGEVMQYNADTGVAEFVKPISYIAKPCDTMLHFKTTRGVDMLLSPEHRVLYKAKRGDKQMHVESAGEIASKHWTAKQGFRGGFPTAFTARTDSHLDMTDAQLRVMVAVIADGHFPSDTSLCAVRLKRLDKKVRLRMLLDAAGIHWTERAKDYRTAVGYAVFRFHAPRREKDFGGWWAASSVQLKSICDEVVLWDGSQRVGKRRANFSTRVKASADFIQYAFSAVGVRCTISEHQRDRHHEVGGKVYYDNGIDYGVNPSAGDHHVAVSCSAGGEQKDNNVSVVDAPGGMKYCFEVPSSFLVLRRNGKVFCTGNTGKTISVVWALDYLRTIGRAKRALIVAPLSLLEDTWAKEFRNGAPGLRTVVLHGTAAVRKRAAATAHDIAIVNYDGVEIIYDQLLANAYDVVIFDESTYLKNINRRWKFCYGVARNTEWVWALTGTPTAQAPTDAYGQCKLLLGSEFPYNEGGWKSSTMQQLTKFRWVPKPEAITLVQHWMQPSIYIRKRDVLKDLPPLTRQRRHVELSAEQKRMLSELRKEATASTEGGQVVTAVHAAALNLKLIQVASGSVYDEFSAVVEVDNAPRLKELVAIVGETRELDEPDAPRPNNKVLVFCAFKHTVHAVAEHLRGAGFNVAEVTGDTSAGKRVRTFQAFQDGRELEVIVAIPDVMSHGLTLTAATATVWFTPITSNEKFTQAANRTDRPGQVFPMTMWELYATQAEKLMYDRLDEREKHQKDVLAAYRELVSFL